MKIKKSKLADALIFEPKLHQDQRGFFLESFRKNVFSKATNAQFTFVQENHSRSIKGVMRGLHLQKNRPQGKLVRVTSGSVLDVAVDLRPASPSFKKWDAVLLDDIDHKIFWIPPGFAHGFIVLSKSADFVYKCTEYYDSEDEITINWNDEDIGIKWPNNIKKVISERDKNGISLKEYLEL